MTLYNVITTLVTLSALALSLTTIHYAKQSTREALNAMRDLLLELARSESEEVRQDTREERIRVVVTALDRRVNNHSQRLNELEDLVDLLNHDSSDPITQDADESLTSEMLPANDWVPALAAGWTVVENGLPTFAELQAERLRRQEHAQTACHDPSLGALLPDGWQTLSREPVTMRPSANAFDGVIKAAQKIDPSIGAAHAGEAEERTEMAVRSDRQVTTVVTDEPDLGDDSGSFYRAQYQVERVSPVAAPSYYAASVRELARHHLKFSLDWYLNEDLARKDHAI
jgi:hypothetical protein